MQNTLFYIGRLPKPAKLTTSGKGTSIAKFALLQDQYAGNGQDPETLSVYFTAFGKTAEAIAEHTTTGDQLILRASIEKNNYTDADGTMQYGYNFIVDACEFGAPGQETRDRLNAKKAAAPRQRKAAPAPVAATADDDIPF